MCVLATQVQARTQQLTALEGQSELLLFRAHGRNLAAARCARQDWYTARRAGVHKKMERILRRSVVAAVACWLVPAAAALAQTAGFTITWKTVGQVVTAGATEPPKGAQVARVDVQPTVVELAVGKQMCLSSLQISVLDAQGRPVAGAALSIAVREDHKQSMQLSRPKGDVCIRPAYAGEYPVRFTSTLPARDGSVRGAQIFVRAS